MQTAPNNNGSKRATKPKRNRKPRQSYTDVTEIDGTAQAKPETAACNNNNNNNTND